jgi:hypothetical protein
MFTRRQVVAQGPLAALSATIAPGPAHPEAEAQDQDSKAVVEELRRFQAAVRAPLSAAFESNTVAFGYVPKLRLAYTEFLKTNTKFPDFCDIGVGVFYDLYDWHVKNLQPIQVARTADNRMTIRFMYTTHLVKLEMDPGYIGIPFDRT